jgi:hypothetical protein
MQKVVGSNPIIRSPEPAGNGGFFVAARRRCSPGSPVRQRLGSVQRRSTRNLRQRGPLWRSVRPIVALRSAFFFHGHLQPAELANFNVENVALRDRKGGRVELMSNGIAVWWPSRPRAEFLDLAGAAGAWFRTTASAYYLETSIPVEPQLEGWVEALDVTVNEAMIGFADPRFVKVRPPEPNATVNADMLRAIEVAKALRRAGGEIERAAHELLAAANRDGAVLP